MPFWCLNDHSGTVEMRHADLNEEADFLNKPAPYDEAWCHERAFRRSFLDADRPYDLRIRRPLVA